MTYLTTANNKVSTLNSTATPLTASSQYLGTTEDVSLYNTVVVNVVCDIDSAPLGVAFEFSQDGTNWDVVQKCYHEPTELNKDESEFLKSVQGKYFRLRYTNSGTNQTFLRIQTILSSREVGERNIKINEDHIDSFGRLKVANPYTLLSVNHVLGKNSLNVFEKVTGLATSTHNTNTSSVELSTTGTGDVIRRSRRRSIYQPGKALLVMMTGTLNRSSNPATVTTKIGHYDDESGHYFQYNNGVISIVERTSISGSLVETVVPQSGWNACNNVYLDPSKALIFWFELEWLGVGSVKCGVVINTEFILLHKFRHSNLLADAYIQTASLPPTVEIISTGGSGSMSQVCFTSVSEGGYNLTGNSFSINNVRTTKTIDSTPVAIITLRLKSTGAFPKVTALYNNFSIISTTSANSLVEIYKFNDLSDTSVLTSPSWVSVNDDSAVEYDVSSTAVVLTNGILIESYYVSAGNDFGAQRNTNNKYIAVNDDGVSDLLCLVVRSVGNQNESYLASIAWDEFI